jgi:hypothetical protein
MSRWARRWKRKHCEPNTQTRADNQKVDTKSEHKKRKRNRAGGTGNAVGGTEKRKKSTGERALMKLTWGMMIRRDDSAALLPRRARKEKEAQ